MSTSRVSRFLYSPVQSGHIRLIRVQQQSNRPYISCDIKVVRLEDGPQFAALSYTWGGQVPNRILFIEGAWLMVTPNLYAFLLQVQNFGDEAKERGVEWIWADSLCINQQDDADKSIQIGMMGQIYQKAQQVVVWLGEATHAVEKLFRQLEKRDEMLSGDDSQPVAIPVANQAARAPFMDLQPAVELLSHPYWQRVWILQEVTSSPTDEVSLWYGHASCSFSKFLELRLAIDHRYDARRRSFEVLEFLRASRRDGSVKMSDIFSMKGQWQASDPKDKLLALLQLSTDGFGYTPDYSLSVDQLHTDFAKYLVEKYGHLDCLEHPTNTLWREEVGHRSSWAPDWGIDGHPDAMKDIGERYRTKIFQAFTPFRNTFLEGRLNLSAECRTQRGGRDSQILHVDAILLAVRVDRDKLRDSGLIYLPRYTEALPDEASLWTTALNPSIITSVLGVELVSYNDSFIWPVHHGRHVQNGDILCVLPGLRWPAYIRPVKRKTESHGYMSFSYVGHSGFPPYKDSHNYFAGQMFDIMLDDILLNADVTHDSYSMLLDLKASRRLQRNLRKEALETKSVARRRGLTMEEILPDTDLRKYAMRIKLV